MLEEKVQEAVLDELRRQAEQDGEGLRVADAGPDRVRVEGHIDLQALATAIVGAVAGGP